LERRASVVDMTRNKLAAQYDLLAELQKNEGQGTIQQPPLPSLL